MMMVPPPKDSVKRVAIDRTYTMTAMNGVVRMMASTNSVEPAFARNESPRAPPFFAPDQCPSFVVSSFLPPVLAYEGTFMGLPSFSRCAPLVMTMASSTSVSRSTRERIGLRCARARDSGGEDVADKVLHHQV